MIAPRKARLALALVLLVIDSTLGVVRDVVDVLRESGHLRFTVSVIFAGCAFTALAMALRHSRAPLRTVAALSMCALPYIAVVQLMHTPEERIHLVEYGVVALLAYASFRSYALALAITLAAGWLDEGIQALLPNRRYDLRDVAFNLAAGALALTSLAAATWNSASKEPER